jgi:hypothetical protein
MIKPVNTPTADVEILIGNEGMDLKPYGIPGQVLHTPGHTDSSVSVLLELGARKIYPAHGTAFPADVMRKALDL